MLRFSKHSELFQPVNVGTGAVTLNLEPGTLGSNNKFLLKAKRNLSVISHTLSLNLGVVQVLPFVASENSMFDSQFSLIARTRLHQLRVKNLTAIHPMAIYRVVFFNRISLSVPNFELWSYDSFILSKFFSPSRKDNTTAVTVRASTIRSEGAIRESSGAVILPR
jgi:hypothetical protein